MPPCRKGARPSSEPLAYLLYQAAYTGCRVLAQLHHGDTSSLRLEHLQVAGGLCVGQGGKGVGLAWDVNLVLVVDDQLKEQSR